MLDTLRSRYPALLALLSQILALTVVATCLVALAHLGDWRPTLWQAALGQGVLAAALSQAGFREVVVERVPAPVRMPSAAECVRFERESFGALHQMMSTLSNAERDDTWGEIERELGRFENGTGFHGPCELLVGGGAK